MRVPASVCAFIAMSFNMIYNCHDVLLKYVYKSKNIDVAPYIYYRVLYYKYAGPDFIKFLSSGCMRVVIIMIM